MSWLSWILSNVALASFVAAAAWFVQRRLRCPAAARVLWVLALVKLVTPPLVGVSLVKLPGAMACAVGACGCAQHAGVMSRLNTALLVALLGIWVVGAAATLALAWRRWMQFRRLVAHAQPASSEWQARASRVADELSLGAAPAILAAPGRLPPLVVPGWGRPQVLLPAELLERLGDSQRDALLLHEFVHIRRGDHRVRLLELAVSVAYWWLPCVRAIGRQLRSCEETCCDAAVVARLPHGRRDYARLLLDVIDFADPLPPHAVAQATAMSAGGDLEQRVRAILGDAEGVRRRRLAGAVAVALAVVVLPCELRYEFVGQRASTALANLANGDACDPTTGTSRFLAVCEPVPIEAFGCPEMK